MNILQRAASKIFSLDIGNKNQSDQLAPFLNTAFAKWSGMFIGRTAKNLNAAQVSAKGLVYACINEYVKAETSRQIFVKLKTNQRDTTLAPLNHKAVELLDEPNPVYSAIELRSLAMKYLKQSGNVFYYTPDFDYDFPCQMWLLEPSRMRIIYGNDGNLIHGYEYQGYGGVIFFPEKYICHIRTLEPVHSLSDPTKQLIGTGVVEAALDDANISSEGRTFLKNYFLNDARPPQVLTDTENRFDTQEKWELFKTDWNNKNKSNKIHGYFYGGRKIESIPNGTLDMNFVEVDKLVKQSVTEIFSISLTQIEGTYGSRATAEVVRGNFYVNGVNPDLRLIGSALTRHFRQWRGYENITIEYDYYVDTDEGEKRAQELHELLTGQITINELRAKINKPAIPDGDTIFVPNGATTLKKALEAPAPLFGVKEYNELVSPEVKQLTNGSDVKKNFNWVIQKQDDPKLIFWKSFDKLTMTNAEKLQGQISEVFGKLEREVLGNVEKAIRDVNTNKLPLIVKADLLQTSNLFDEDEWIKQIEQSTHKTLTDLQKQAILQSLSAVDEAFENLPSDFNDAMAKELEKSTAKISESIGTIKGELQKIIENNNDISASELKDLITSKFDTLKVSRAETIAKTSANFTTNAAQSKVWGDLDIDSIWLSQRDGVVRADHAAADGQKKNENGMFTVGGATCPYPCGTGIAEQDINCRCMQYPVRKKGKAFVVNLSFAIQYLRAA